MESRSLAVARALDAERADVRAWLHDRVLRMLDHLAVAGDDVARLQAVAALAADELRGFVEGDAPPARTDLVTALVQVVSEAQRLGDGLEIEVVVGAGDADLAPALIAALAAAAGEALAGVREHARARRARVTCDADDRHAEVTIEHDGVDPAPGRGAAAARLRAAGGSAQVDASQGSGTRVRLRAPVRPPAF